MITCKSESELELMRVAGRIVAETHLLMAQAVQPGVTTLELDRIAEQFIRSQGAYPSFKGYHGFPASICASVNDELVHGIPGPRKLQDGDIISIDIGAQYKGYHGDSAWTYPVGRISEQKQKLLKITEEALYAGIAEVKPGARLYSISHAIQQIGEQNGYSIVREYAGHGIGQSLHEDPDVPNYGPYGRGPSLKPGMVLAIEPMFIEGQRFVRTLEDQWTVVTKDGTWCTHFEHTVAITAEGYEILTLPRTQVTHGG
ncbi:type I methionyl aminopeptidase [Paenibacillus sp. y28]|uniref:type I methionyl aminopeptidase n=1 Tax=Paenibacillus sp. y28 TaxID=3129110 RepID=UPI003018070C